ncbi:MAG: hypothetical protein QOI95_101 [Acidimicrobiaceae bacterium]|jgi:uncharacterized protein (TIGR03083 family)
MTLPRSEVVAGTAAQLSALEDLIRSLDDAQWKSPTRCTGWTISDIAAHVTGQLVDIVAGRFDRLAGPDATAIQVKERSGRTPHQIADELHEAAATANRVVASLDDAGWNGPGPSGLGGTVGHGVEGIWNDAWIHTDDIRAALGLSSDRGAGLRASVSFLTDLLTRRGWGSATLKLDGFPPLSIGRGGHPDISGDALTFVLVVTGRADPAVFALDETINVYR